MQRRHVVGAMAAGGAHLLTGSAWAGAGGPSGWPAWTAFKRQFVSQEGRVVDPGNAARHTVSEAQAYALFFALVANDPSGFELLLRWTENNLCQGDMSAHLPAWRWGRRADGSWDVIDTNSASDADVWLAYTLGEAGRLWNDARYSSLCTQIGARILAEETAELPGLGLALLPGPQGFAIAPGRWRLNASYSPPQLLQRLAQTAAEANAPLAWDSLAKSGEQVILASAPKGFIADWIVYDSQEGFMADSQGPEKTLGSYNAIRVYLWAGTLHPQAPQRERLLQALRPMALQVRSSGQVPESVDSQSGRIGQPGPGGFKAALMPFMQAQGDTSSVRLLEQQLRSRPLRAEAYYEQVLGLFALGWMTGAYRYGADGRLLPSWKPA